MQSMYSPVAHGCSAGTITRVTCLCGTQPIPSRVSIPPATTIARIAAATVGNANFFISYREIVGNAPMLNRLGLSVNRNVTHRLCTHRLHGPKMSGNAARHPHSFWPRNSPREGRAEDHPGGGCGKVRASPDVLQRYRARSEERFVAQHRTDCDGVADQPTETFQPCSIVRLRTFSRGDREFLPESSR